MGRIFSFEDITSGNIPLMNNFALIKQDIINELTANSDITGAIICGSLNHGTYNLRSDIDVMVHHDGSAEVQQLLSSLCTRAAQLYLELNFIEVTPETVEKQFYDINWNFYQHLELAANTGGLIKQNFLPVIELGYVDRNQELLSYIEFKLNYFEENIMEEGLEANDAKKLEVLRKALEMPAHIARKYVCLRGVVVTADNKKAVREDYAQVAPPILSMYLRLLMAADEEYTKLLKRQLVAPDKADYERTIAGLVTLTPQIKGFAYENMLLLNELEGENQKCEKLLPVAA